MQTASGAEEVLTQGLGNVGGSGVRHGGHQECAKNRAWWKRTEFHPLAALSLMPKLIQTCSFLAINEVCLLTIILAC